MCHDQWQGVRMTRTYVCELNIETVDLSHKLRQGVQARLHLSPVVVRPQYCTSFFIVRQPHALGLISNSLLLKPACRCDTLAEIADRFFRNVEAEGADCVVFSRCMQLPVEADRSQPRLRHPWPWYEEGGGDLR